MLTVTGHMWSVYDNGHYAMKLCINHWVVAWNAKNMIVQIDDHSIE